MNPALTPAESFQKSLVIMCVMACTACGGCAAITNPVADGIPVRRLPPELLAEPKADKVAIPLEWLRQEQPEVYLLAPDDILGVYVEGVLGARGQLPPVNVPTDSDLPPSLGYPIPVRENGTVPLPLIDPVSVEGLSITQAEQAIIKAYTVDKEIFQGNRERIMSHCFSRARLVCL